MSSADNEARDLLEQVFGPMTGPVYSHTFTPTPTTSTTSTTSTTCTTGRVVALAAAGFALGAATTVAVALVTEAVVRRLGRAIDEAELAEWFPTGWLR